MQREGQSRGGAGQRSAGWAGDSGGDILITAGRRQLAGADIGLTAGEWLAAEGGGGGGRSARGGLAL